MNFYSPSDHEIFNLFQKASQDYIAIGHRYAKKHKVRGQFGQKYRLRFLSKKIFNLLPINGIFVDVGTGSGILTRMIHFAGQYQVIGIENKFSAGEEDTYYLQKAGIEMHFCQVGSERIPLSDNSVDVVIAANVIEHLFHSPKKFLEDIFRILKPGGSIILETDNSISLKTRLRVLMGIPNWTPIEAFYEDEFNYHHHKEYTLKELMDVLKYSRFVNIKGQHLEALWQLNLKKLGRQNLMDGDLESLSQFTDKFNPFHIYNYVRLFFLLLIKFRPTLRSTIYAEGLKPL